MTLPSAEDAQVYVRPEVLYFDEQRLHLSDEKEYEIADHDAALMELVFRGDSDFRQLCRQVAALGTTDMAAVAAQLSPVLRDPRSILELRAAVPMPDPDIIVCDFTDRPRLLATDRLVAMLRRKHRVLHLGLDAHVRGPWPLNAGLVGSRDARCHDSWFEFAQWCRGIVGRNEQALLVLAGQQDAILFGDLAARLRTVVLLDPSWPAQVGVTDLLGADWVPADPFDAIRDLYYALRFSSLEDLAGVNRTTGTGFAKLEGFALKHAAAVAYGMSDQPAALARFGRPAGSDRLVHGMSVRRLRKFSGEPPRLLLLAAGVEQGLQPLVPFLHLVRPVLDQGLVQQVVLVTGDGWYRVVFGSGMISVQPIGPRRPHPSHCVGGIAFPGLLRDCRPAFEILAQGVPMGVVRSARPHPLQAIMPAPCLFGSLDIAGLAVWLQRITTPADPLAGDLVAAGHALLRQTDVVALVRSLLPAANRVAAEDSHAR